MSCSSNTVIHQLIMIIILETFTVVNKVMLYANNYYCHYHSIIIDFKINYEKQILITKMKINQHYNICIISFYERKNFCNVDRFEVTKAQKFKSLINSFTKSNRNILIEFIIKNFVWNHAFLDIYNVILIDILYQLYNNNMINYVSK